MPCRVAALLLSLAILAPGLARAQEPAADARIEFSVELDAARGPRGGRDPIVRTRNFVGDTRWLTMLRSGFPLRLHYRVETWRSRDAWFDDFVRQIEWDIIIRHEPLLDQFTVRRIQPRARFENRYATTDALDAALGLPFRIAIAPSGPGTYYYAASVQITTLSDSDLKELERLLGGDLGTDNSGSAVGREARRLVLRLAGLPSVRLEGRTASFEVR